eukprot:c19051_g1_i1.p1 GENE.c19051_g1_i1~~c19051_g1_i1.p1  ORF type:complete len:255 (+),score=38.30 c19051_g1_i1:120-884(+)
MSTQQVNGQENELKPLMAGVVGIALRNAKDRFFFPSTSNSFQGFKVENLLFDSGCNTFLLYLPTPEHLQDLKKDFQTCNWMVSRSKGVSSEYLSIRIGEISSGLKFTLCSTFSSFMQVREFSTSCIRFHICQEDIQYILQHKDDFYGLLSFGWPLLEEFKDQKSDRRKHGIVGQSLFRDNPGLSMIQHEDILIIVDRTKFDWNYAKIVRLAFLFPQFHFPDKQNAFNDLEVDFTDVYENCSSSALGSGDYIDEI